MALSRAPTGPAASPASDPPVGLPSWLQSVVGRREAGFSGTPLAAARFNHGGPGQASTPALDRHLLVVTVGRLHRLERRMGTLSDTAAMAPGSLTIIPAGQATSWRWDGPARSIQLYLDPEILSAVRDGEEGHASAGLLPRLGFVDPFLALLAQGLLRQHAQGLDNRLCDELVAFAVAAHLLRRHAPGGPGMPRPFTPAEASRVEDFLDASIAEEFGLGDLAAAAGLDRAALVDGFLAADGHRLSRLLADSRLRKARLLLESGAGVAEAAGAAGYPTADALSAAFALSLGCSPSQYRRQCRG